MKWTPSCVGCFHGPLVSHIHSIQIFAFGLSTNACPVSVMTNLTGPHEKKNDILYSETKVAAKYMRIMGKILELLTDYSI